MIKKGSLKLINQVIKFLKFLRLYNSIKYLYRLLKRISNKPKWHNLRTIVPVSKVFGLDMGTPIDRIYIEDFLYQNSNHIKGVVCEIAEKTYSKNLVIMFQNLRYFITMKTKMLQLLET